MNIPSDTTTIFAIGFLIVFVLVLVAGALFFYLAEDVTEPGYGSPTPNGVPYVPPHFTTGAPGVIALATELSRRLAETPRHVFTTPDGVVIESAQDSLPYGQWFTITLTETPTGFKRWDQQRTGHSGLYNEAVPSTSFQWGISRSWSVGASWELERVDGKWVKRRTDKPFDLDHEIQQSLRAIGAKQVFFGSR